MYDPVATYVYDGDANRVQQVDHSGSQSVTTTYTNDNIGLSQVLVADDGATTTHNLFGLDLIQQDDGSDIRTLLADGLGSVRQEMVGGAVESVTTYEPFGKLLAQTGSSGTVYGYTGEQHDGATGLVYLRARYYDPSLKVFVSRDPFSGSPTFPASQHPYAYVHNNPVNLTDPSGNCAEPVSGTICLVVGGVIVIIVIYVVAHAINQTTPPIIDSLSGVLTDASHNLADALESAAEACRTLIFSPTQTQAETDRRPNGDALAEELFGPNARPAPQANPDLLPIPNPQPTPTSDDNSRKIVRVRHYSRAIDAIKNTMVLKDPVNPVTLNIWIEYPITTSYDEKEIQATTASFFRPLNGIGGFVEFNVDLDKWTMEQDPNLPSVPNAKVIALYKMGLVHAKTGFPLNEPDVNPKFYNWRGESIN